MSGERKPSIKRGDVYPGSVIDGRTTSSGAVTRIRSKVQSALVSKGEREEAEVEHLIRSQPGLTRANTVSVISPKGGVGKTTSSFLIGNLLADRLKLRVVAVDANPDFGTLSALAPDHRRTSKNLGDLIADMEGLSTAAELSPYVSRLPSGLHLMGAPQDADAMWQLGPDAYGKLLAFLGVFYEVVILDLGTGITDPLAQFAVERSDQVVVITTPEWITSQSVLGALRYLSHERATLVLNQAIKPHNDHVRGVEMQFREQRLRRSVTIPYDEQLRTMLDSGTYTLEGLRRETRRPVKLLGLAVAEQLV